MKKNRGKRVQLKRIRFQINQAINSNQNPFPFLLQLKDLEIETKTEKGS